MSGGCPCGFDGFSVWPVGSPAWHRAHRAAHLAAFPDLDDVSRLNLDLFVEWAEAREAPVQGVLL